MREFACVVGAKSASWRSGVCDAIRPYCKIHPCCKIHPHFKFTHVEGGIENIPQTGGYRKLSRKMISNNDWHGMRAFACVVGANCNSPTPQFAHIAKFIHVANSSTPQFAYIVFRPYYEFTHVEGLIAISPYACVFWMLANIM